MLVVILIQSVLYLQGVYSETSLQVALPNGIVQGSSYSNPTGREFYFWKGIPFAKPPLGSLRFQPPVKPDPWSGVLDGTQEPKACLFERVFPSDPAPTSGNSEDCLYLNVYSPYQANSNMSVPVVFFVYPGAFVSGAADTAFQDPITLLDEDVIVVVANYRLSLFGFLSTEDEVMPGNSALMDQLVAMQWTKDNIAYFGGNPNDITLWGHSSGGVSVGFHLQSPLTRGMFSAVILMSATHLVPLEQVTPRQNAWQMAGLVNSSITSSSTSQEIVEALQLADADLLVHLIGGFENAFLPVVDLNSSWCYLNRPFYESLQAGNFNQVPVLIGTTSNEIIVSVGNLSMAHRISAEADKNVSEIFPGMVLKNGVSVDAVSAEVKEAYVGNDTFENNLCNYITLLSDNMFSRGIVEHAILHSRYAPVYFYQSSYEGTRSENNLKLPGCGRVAHADDLAYIFNMSTRPIVTDADYLARSRYVKLFSNFVKYKNPIPADETSELLQNVTWDVFDEVNLQYLDIGDTLELKYHQRANTTYFWQRLWDSYSVRPYVTF